MSSSPATEAGRPRPAGRRCRARHGPCWRGDLGFAVNFWAWALISPLGAFFTDELGPRAVQKSLLVAVPVVVGSLGRIPVGALTDRFGGADHVPARQLR